MAKETGTQKNKEVETIKEESVKIKASIKKEIIDNLLKSKRQWDIRNTDDVHESTKKVIIENIENYQVVIDTINKIEEVK